MSIVEASDYSWNPSKDNLQKQARICVGVNLKPVLMDINTSVGVGPTISSLEDLGISRINLQPSSYGDVVLQRGRKLYQLPVLGQSDLVIHHARGRTFRQRTAINLERDAKAFNLRTIIVEKFPSECSFGILAGHDFLRQNNLRLDEKNGQMVNVSTYPPKTVIQYLSPDRQFYLRSHSLFWEKHFKPEIEKPAKIVPPTSCENCGKNFKPIKKGETFIGEYKKGEMILYHGEVNYFPCKLGLTVRNYSNNHLIKAVYKKNKSKMVLTVPECAVRRINEDESTVIPVKHNPSNKNSDSKLLPKAGAIETETKKEVVKMDSSTQTYCPNGLYPTEPNVQNLNKTKVQKNKRKTFSKVRSEFSECLYPFQDTEDWVNACPSECSDVSYKSFETSQDIPVCPNLSENDKKILLQLSDPFLREYFLGIRGMHSDYSPKYKTEKRRKVFIEPRSYLKKDITTDETHDYPNISDTDWFKEFECSESVNKNINSQHLSLTVPERCFRTHGPVIIIPDRCFKFHNTNDEDVLGEAGGGEEGGLRHSM